MSFHADVLEGINAFTAMRNATKSSPYEDYYKFLMENSPQGQQAKAKAQAAQDMKAQGFVLDPNTGQWVQKPPAGGGGVPPVTTTGINFPTGAIQTSVLPAPTGDQNNYRRGGVVRGYQDGGTAEETPEERERRIWGDETINKANAARDKVLAEIAQRRAARPTPGEDRGEAPSWPPPADAPVPPDQGPGTGFEGGAPYADTTGHKTVLGAMLPPLSSPAPGTQPTPVPPTAPPAGGPPMAGGSPRALPPQFQPPQVDQPQPLPAPTYPGQGLPTPPNQPVPSAPAINTAPGGARAPVGGAPAPRGALRDQTRTAAFDPTADAQDPDNAHVVDQTGSVNQAAGPPLETTARAQQAFNKAVDGGAHFGQWLTRAEDSEHPHGARDRMSLRAGVGAMPADVAANVQKAWSDGGRITPGQAMIRYMVYQHQHLSENGQTAQANQMAFEVMQRLNLEAARYGENAITALKNGDVRGAVGRLQAAHDMVPDGKELAVSRDGSHMVLRDQFTGQPTTHPIQINTQTILASAMGLRDGSSMWNYLQGRAALMTAGKPDKDAEGRALRNRNTALRGIRLQQQIDKAKGGGGGGGGTSPGLSRLNEILSGKKPAATTTIIKQGSDDDDSMREEPVPAEETD